MSYIKSAYLREYDSKKCDLRFMLVVKTSNGESLEKEIIGFAKPTDTLHDLKKSIQEKITGLSKNNNDQENNEIVSLDLPATASEIKVVFQKRNKLYQENKTLQDFIKNISTNCDGEYIQVLGQKFAISLNAPLVRQVRLPSSIYANFGVEPAKLSSHNMQRQSSKFIWSKSLDKVKWEKVGEGYQYQVSESDVDHYLKLFCIPYNQFKIKGPSVEAISDYVVEIISEFPRCPFEDRHSLTKQRLKGNKFRVVSYNVLADRYVDGIQFSYCPPKALGIHYRKQLIIKELKGYYPDIICLQEVDHPHYKEYYQEELNRMGFKSLYNRKGNCIPEGLVCAFLHKRFKLLESKHLVLRTAISRKQLIDVLNLLNLNEDVKQEFLQQNTSLQVTVLQEHKTKNIVIVGNTHLYYHPDADHIRLLQAFMATGFLNNIKTRLLRGTKMYDIMDLQSHIKPDQMRKLQCRLYFSDGEPRIDETTAGGLASSTETEDINLNHSITATAVSSSNEYDKNNIAVMICGDFNSDFKKSLYGFMIRGTIDPEHEDCLKISASGNARIYHRFHLASASGTPKYTNYTDHYKGCLDYIFIERNKLLVNKVIPVPTEAELRQYTGLPNEFFPSDHLSLVVDLEFSCK